MPISSKFRRESFAQSLTGNGGLSWAGISVGSWVRDDILMAGTSPAVNQPTSFHSSSYLPKLEAQFFKEFLCCGKTLPGLHDLLGHYEQFHAHQQPPNMANIGGMQDDAYPPRQQQQHLQIPGANSDMIRNTPGFATQMNGMGNGIDYGMMRQQQLARLQKYEAQNHEREDQDDDDDAEAAGEMDMEMDDITPSPRHHSQSQTPQHPNQQQLPFQSSQRPQTSLLTQNLQAVQQQQQHHNQPFNQLSPESSAPGTPLALEHNDQFSHLFPGQNVGGMPVNAGFGGYQGNHTGGPDLSLDMGCIDQPGKTLYSPNGLNGLTAAEMRRLRQGIQMGMAGGDPPQLPGGFTSRPDLQMSEIDDKPFKCPVIGCEKAYKNQNGLKYHKGHGHTNQQLQENPDGTVSIVNPETSTPYPGTLGMEKEKPYRCEFCGKRYKNLNGLKYHRGHSQRCAAQIAQPPLAPGAVVSVAGGIPGEMPFV
ncbi:hypothetical protein BJ508DRAFT_216264 [Ascobolus immersus RN42]|uniref:C2H2-type domain-containing protein n=1 Tax=Ascobolus immersus RN42 TaxID=1160509 RepID=A0A3N4HUI9_ASCIM|nr:hypothetical protein BJ508DRAFT_216264 [Ascobolus immersus RN42]